MIPLLPTEAWEYSVRDVIRASYAAFRSTKEIHPIEIAGIGPCLPVRSGRVGILLALKSLDLRQGSRIGVPLYCCPVVFKAIRMAGHIPIFIDTDVRNYCISTEDLSAKASKLDALIAVHLFGNMCNMPAILEIMKEKPVIEDCAQSLGSALDGRLSGNFGFISMFSFRSGKYLAAGEGGALYCHELRLKSKIEELIKTIPIPSVKSELLHIIGTYARSKLRSKPLWGLLGSKLWKIYNKKVDFISKSPISLTEIFASDLQIINDRMLRLPAMISRQRKNAQYYLDNLRLPKDMFCHEPHGSYYNRFMFPIKFRSSEQCVFVSDFLLRKNISTSRPYLDVIEGAAKHYGYKGDCPEAEKLLKSTLIIPVHYGLSNKHLKYIKENVNQAWEAIGQA